MFWPCETRTSTCRSFATISSGLYRFLAIAVLLDLKDIPQVGPLQWGWITGTKPMMLRRLAQLPLRVVLDRVPRVLPADCGLQPCLQARPIQNEHWFGVINLVSPSYPILT